MTEQNLLSEHEEYVKDSDDIKEADLEIYTETWEGGEADKIKVTTIGKDAFDPLPDEHYVDVVKKYAETNETYTDDDKGFSIHQATVEYKGQEVQFSMYGSHAKRFNATGGKGDTIRVRRRKIWDNANDRGYSRYEFIKQD